MSNKEQVLKKIKELKQEVERLEESEDLEVYACNVDVNVAGDILFNDEKQVLSVNYRENEPFYEVSANNGENCKDDFVFVKCEREDLEPGDTVYAKHSFEDYEFDALEHVLKILKNESDNNLECVRVEDDGDIIVSYLLFSGSLYKLVRKTDI